jgi:exodeoxyribonuclease VII large subunit
MHRIEQLESHLRTSLKQLMVKETHRLQLIEQVTESASPQLMLQRGYSITRCNGKVVRDASILSPGVLLTTEFADGMVQSEVRTPQN